jgi:hypothetical protein
MTRIDKLVRLDQLQVALVPGLLTLFSGGTLYCGCDVVVLAGSRKPKSKTLSIAISAPSLKEEGLRFENRETRIALFTRTYF